MDAITNKALVIAVGIFITIAITSAILITIDQMKNVYSSVYETDITISNGFQEFDEYDNTEKTGVDLINTLNKYYNNSNVNVTVGTAQNKNRLNNTQLKSYISSIDYNKLYNCNIEKKGDNVKITFKVK